MPRSPALALALLLAWPCVVSAQAPVSSDLYGQILEADGVLFDQAFNHCDLAALDQIVSDDFRFVHDQNGETRSKAAFEKDFRDSICANPDRKPIRKLIDGSMTVFPLYNGGRLYGALQMGEHRFYIQEPGKPLYQTTTGRFTSTWVLEDGRWRLRSSLSYDHHDPAPTDMFDADWPAPLFDDTARIGALMKAHRIPSMAVATINDGRVQAVRVFGVLDDGSPAPMNTIYNVASLTKPVTALTTLKLAAAGLWDLDQPLSDSYVDPDLVGSPELRYLTTRMVLSQRSGLPNWRYLAPDHRLRFEFRPGTRYQYSGEGFEWLRKALEARFGKGLDVLAREQIFEPLGMNDTHFRFETGVDEARFAGPHDALGAPLPLRRNTTVNAADNLLTTAPDYARFMAWILRGADLPPALYAEMVKAKTVVSPGVRFGLGWGRYEDLDGKGDYALQHTGGDDGVKAIAILFPNSGRGLLIIANSENGVSLWKKIIEETYGAEGVRLVSLNLGK